MKGANELTDLFVLQFWMSGIETVSDFMIFWSPTKQDGQSDHLKLNLQNLFLIFQI